MKQAVQAANLNIITTAIVVQLTGVVMEQQQLIVKMDITSQVAELVLNATAVLKGVLHAQVQIHVPHVKKGM